MREQQPQEPAPRDPRKAALAGLIVIMVLILGALFLIHVLGGVARIQDCVMSGRTNCAPIDQPANNP